MFVGMGANSSGGYNLESSLRFRSSANAYLNWTPASAGNRTTWTWSGWVKRGILGSQQIIYSAGIITNGGSPTNSDALRFESNDTIDFLVGYTGSGFSGRLISTAVFRDPSAWYHIVVVWDSTNATSTDRIRLYINNTRQPVTLSVTPSLSSQSATNTTYVHNLGRRTPDAFSGSWRYFDGYMTEVNFVDGQALTPSDFGETDTTTGVWKPKEYTGTYGTNGFYLPMKETTQADGFNTVLWTGNGGTQSISNVGFSPDLVWVKSRSGAYANMLQDTIRGAGKSLFSNLTTQEVGNSGDLITSFDSNGFTVNTTYLGGYNETTNNTSSTYVGWCWDTTSNNTTGSELVTNGTFDSGTTGWTNVNCSYSVSNGKLSATFTSSGAYVWQAVSGLTIGQKYVLSGQCSGANDFFRVYTGSAIGTGETILGGNASSNAGLNQVFFEASATTVYIRIDVPNSQTITWDDVSIKQVSYDGTIPSYTKTNTSTGFSIITYTGTGSAGTIGHGLGASPKFIIVKDRSATNPWVVYHDSLGVQYYTLLNATDASYSNLSDYWSATAPSSTVFGINSYGGNNTNGNNYVAYCFSEVAGYSKFGSYTGNGSTSGPTVTTGFRPAFVMVKGVDRASTWRIYDNTRDQANPPTKGLFPHLSNAESTAESGPEFLDNGFQISSASGNQNASGEDYIYMAFADTRDAQFNFDASGNKNNWTPNNINSNASSETTYDIMNDVATLTDEDTANFCTLNPLLPSSGATIINYSNGNLTATTTAGTPATESNALSTMYFPSTGKFYAELTIVSTLGSGSNSWPRFGVAGYAMGIGGYVNFGGSSYGTFANGDVMNLAWDSSTGKVWFGKNGTWLNSGDPVAGTGNISTFTYDQNSAYVQVNLYSITATSSASINFGQRPFAYTPPTGYKKLNTYNLPDSTIKDGSQYFDAVTYTGNGTAVASGGKSITSLEFQPDLVWIKDRTSPYHHNISDVIRGASTRVYSSLTNAEDTNTESVNSFDSNGFTVGNNVGVNTSSNAYVAWNWKANGSGVSNTDGTITSTVSANTDSGFSVVTYTGNGVSGATVGHGLGVAPKVHIIKNRDDTGSWAFRTTVIDGSLDYLYLNTTDAKGDISGISSPDNSVFSLTTSIHNNVSGDNYVAYCFADVEGFSKFGSYTGNGSADGPFVYTGFRPAFVMIKKTSSTYNWIMLDTSRDIDNEVAQIIYADLSSAEGTGSSGTYSWDFLSNGFKVRGSGTGTNQSSASYIYMAFAENPFKQSLAR